MIPCILRPLRGPLQLRMDYAAGNRQLIHDCVDDAVRPRWDKQERAWIVARKHLRSLAELLVEHFGAVDVCMDFSTLEKCDARCQNAKGDECTCSCEGVHHGGGYAQHWLQVGETTLISSEVKRRHVRVTRSSSLMPSFR